MQFCTINIKIKFMLKKSILFLLITLSIINPFVNADAQTEDTFTPNGKPLILLFSNLNTSFNKDGSDMAFEITRVYLGYEYFLSENISSRVNIDVGDPGVGKLQMTAYIKNAYVQYKKEGFSARFGMIGADQFKLQEKQWGYRYLLKSFQDEYGFGPSADLGAAIAFAPSEYISFDISVLNGEGYKNLQSDSIFKTTAGLTITPIKGFVLRGYFDRMKNDFAQTSMALYAGYSNKTFKSGIEYNIQKNNSMKDNLDFSGISIYASLGLAKKISIFTRYDKLWSTTLTGDSNPWNNNRDGQLFVAGFDYSPTKGVKIAPTYMGWSPSDKSALYTSTIALNFEIKF
jgi:hypothetical protein